MPRPKLTTTKVKITILPNDEKSINFSFRVDENRNVITETIKFLERKL